jgi:hypothetical protein
MLDRAITGTAPAGVEIAKSHDWSMRCRRLTTRIAYDTAGPEWYRAERFRRCGGFGHAAYSRIRCKG